MIANDDPFPYLREHGWELEPHGAWKLVRPDGVFCLIDLEADERPGRCSSRAWPERSR